MTSKLVVQLNAAGHGDVTLDGEKVPGCYAIDFHAGVSEATDVTLHLRAVEVSVEADVEDEHLTRVAETTDVTSTNRTYRRLG